MSRVAALALLYLLTLPLSAVEWAPISESNLSLTEPRIQSDADAETVFYEVWLEDNMQGTMPQMVVTTYLRIKVYTDRGAEEHSTVDLTTTRRDARLTNVRGRTIKSNGEVIELENAAVFERDVVKTGDRRVRTKSFSLPNVGAGDMIEYQWRAFYDNAWSNYQRLHFQGELPTWLIRYHVKPNADANQIGYRMQSQKFNSENTPFEPEPSGFYETHLENVPALEVEPYMPPEDQVRSWVLLFYTAKHDLDQEKFWRNHGKEKYKEYALEIKVDGTVKAKAAELVAGAETDAERIERIRQYCVGDIRNVYHDRYGVTAEEREQLDERRRPSDTIRSGMGTGTDVRTLFAALLQAAGFDARVALMSGRDDRFFNPGFLNPYFLNRSSVAVETGGEWRFYDPSLPYLPAGMLDWREEGVQALIIDDKESQFVMTPMTGPEQTSLTRVGKFRLDADGSLEGDVIAQFKGHFGIEKKTLYDGQTPEEQETTLLTALRRRNPGADVSDIRIGNSDSIESPFSYRYKIRYPGYAARTGKRLFLQPSFFTKSESPAFPNAERTHDIYFEYPWSEQDRVEIDLPDGFSLEEAESPASLESGKVGAYQVMLATADDGRKLIYKRVLVFGLNDNIYFPVSAYEPLKGLFDFIHEQDGHTVTLREQDGASGGE